MPHRLPATPNPVRALGPALLCASLLALGPAVAPAATTHTWNNPAGGSWSDPGNWTPAGVPDAAGEEAVLPALSGPYQVTLDLSPAADRVTVAAGDPTLDLNGYSLAAVGLTENRGTLRNFQGLYDGNRLRNYPGGTVLGAPDGVLTARDSLENFGGIIVVGPGTLSKLHAPGGLILAGTGRLVLDRSTLFDPAGDFGGRLLVRPGVTLTGSGVIAKRIENYGTLECAGDYGHSLVVEALIFNFGGTIRVAGGGTIRVNRPLVQNRGVIRSGPGGGSFSLRLDSGNLGTIDLQRGGRLVVDGGDLNISCLQMHDGEIQRVGTTGSMNIDIGTLQNMKIAAGADVTVTDHIDFMAAGQRLVNEGTLRVRGSIHFGILNSPDSIWIAGGGVVKLEGGRLGSGNGGFLVNAAGMTIEGCGTILPPFVNEGIVSFDCAPVIGDVPGVWLNGGLLRVRSGRLTVTGAKTVFRNLGRIEADGLLYVERGATVDNRGAAIRTGRGRVLIGNHNSHGTIRGGRLEGAGSGDYYVQRSATLEDVTLAAGATLLTATGAVTQAEGRRFLNEGTVRLQGTGRFETLRFTQYLQTGGATSFEGGQLLSERAVMIEGGEVRGHGTLQGALVNGGRLAPAATGGGLRVVGRFTQTAAGAYAPVLAGPDAGQVGRLTVSGHAELAGALAPALAGGYLPGDGLAFDVLRYGSVGGAFGEVRRFANEVAAGDLLPHYGAGALLLVTGGTTDVGERSAPRALSFTGRVAPSGASLVLELPWPAALDGRLYDTAGREVARFAEDRRAPGVHVFRPQGSGARLASGVYFARIAVTGPAGLDVRTARVPVLR